MAKVMEADLTTYSCVHQIALKRSLRDVVRNHDGPKAVRKHQVERSVVLCAHTRLIFLRQKTPPFRAGDDWRSSSPCATLPAYRRACGNRRLWSGADNQGPNERVSRSQRFAFGRACL